MKKDSAPIKFAMDHPCTLLLIALQAPVTSYFVAAYINNPPPRESTLERTAITVVAAQKFSPHLQIKKSDGNVYLAEFPVTTGIRPKEFTKISDQEMKALVGCSGIAATAPLRGVIPARLNIWEIDCGGVSKSYAEIKKSAEINQKSARSGFHFYLLLAISYTGFFFILEEIARKRKRR